MTTALINIAYLLASILFIVGLKGLAHPRTAVRGNLIGALGMLIAVVAALCERQVLTYEWIVAGMVVGTVAGWILAVKIAMTAMPQLVALFNGFGGLASVLVAGAALVETIGRATTMPPGDFTVATAASGLVGAVTFTGSMIAWAKLQEVMSGSPIQFPGQKLFNLLLVVVTIGLSAMLVMAPAETSYYWWIVLVSSILGVTLTIPIGGADMPVVISLLNSYSGIAAAATGFVLSNNGLIIAGSLVGASGIILTQIMCKGMNRSLANVLFGGMGGEVSGAAQSADKIYAGKVKSASAEEIAMLLENAQRVVFVPGYGMAVAQAQHAVRNLANMLEQRGCTVEYAIHPVAGRMPGHMNVLLAEADVPYDQLKDMDEINPTFEQTDVAIVIGANDVVNPLARTDPTSPIAGMPILDVDKARTVVVIKRSLGSGFAGLPNPLFALDNTLMLFADGKKAVNDLIQALKEAAA